LVGLLDKKELDAALIGTNESLQLFLTGKYRIILDLAEDWERRAGRAPAHVSMDTTEAFAKANPDIIRDFIRAYRDAVRIVRQRSDVWEGYAKSLGIATPEGIALLRERVSPRIVDVWDKKQMEVQTQFLELLLEVLGDKFLKAVPAGLMTDAYNP
jgi:ABC-type nitrate/sulfonate/bicarbonate transport system substrate-binding protein